MARSNKTIVAEINFPAAHPEEGARQAPGKDSNDCDDTLRKGKLPKSMQVEDAKEVEGAAKKCIEQQVYGEGKRKLVGGGNPHDRTRNYWGTDQDKKEV
jgi:hypothetical protein